jgi:16S rRNA (guanine1207-N2)-methyltransferase
LGLSGAVRVLASDALAAVADERYDLIVSNPPFHSGKGVDYAMAQAFIGQSVAALRPGGRLVVVANQFIRYEKSMGEAFSRVKFLAETGTYHVIEGVKLNHEGAKGRRVHEGF